MATETTHEHPFYVEGIGFLNAAELSIGDQVRTLDGEIAIVEDFEEIQLEEPIKVYNFEVEDFHTYYVSKQDVLVHNTCAVPVGGAVSAKATDVTESVVKANAQEYSAEFLAWLNKGEANNVVYHGIKDNKAMYTGITMQDTSVRLAQHKANKAHPRDFDDLEIIYNNLTRNQARAIEQYYIDKPNGPNAWNLINSISHKNRFYGESRRWAKAYIDSH